MPLSQFAEPIESIGGVFKAYRMDDSTEEESDMRRAAGLGTCNCCDYVTVSMDNQSVVFIEETNLEYAINNFKEEYVCLNDKDQRKLFRDKFLRENKLKLYGSMLVLCRLSHSWEEVKNSLSNSKFQFWLVTTTDLSESVILMDNLADDLRIFLKAAFPREMMDVVDIIPSTELAEKLSDEVIEID